VPPTLVTGAKPKNTLGIGAARIYSIGRKEGLNKCFLGMRKNILRDAGFEKLFISNSCQMFYHCVQKNDKSYFSLK
jgi:hypothetical protein